MAGSKQVRNIVLLFFAIIFIVGGISIHFAYKIDKQNEENVRVMTEKHANDLLNTLKKSDGELVQLKEIYTKAQDSLVSVIEVQNAKMDLLLKSIEVLKAQQVKMNFELSNLRMERDSFTTNIKIN